MPKARKPLSAKRVTTIGLSKISSHLIDPLDTEMEREMMAKQETEQTRIDRFWGQEKDLEDRILERLLMELEDQVSAASESVKLNELQQKMWDEELRQRQYRETKNIAARRDYDMLNYLDVLYSANSSDEFVSTVWNSPNLTTGSESFDRSSSAIFQTQDTTGNREQINAQHLVGSRDQHERVAASASVHLDGLQKSRAIINEASFSFKQTLRRLNSNSLTGMLVETHESKAKLETLKHGPSSTKTYLNRSSTHTRAGADRGSPSEDLQAALTAAAEAAAQHLDDIDGHAIFRWDQEQMLIHAFRLLDVEQCGQLRLQQLRAVSFRKDVHAVLKFTVFWSHVKRRNWDFFESMLFLRAAGRAGNMPENDRFVLLPTWLEIAAEVALETDVPLRRIRLREEHEAIVRSAVLSPSLVYGASSASAVVGKALEPLMLSKRANLTATSGLGAGAGCVGGRGVGGSGGAALARESALSRRLQVGDCVWALHAGGVRWLPAVVQRVELVVGKGPVVNENNDNNDNNSNNSTEAAFLYDLWYPLTQKQVDRARVLTATRQLVTLPSSQQSHPSQQDLMPLGHRYTTATKTTTAAGGGNGGGVGGGVGGGGDTSKWLMPRQRLRPKPFSDELSACAYAFDLVDSTGAGSVQLMRLVHCFLGAEFRDVVHTSMVLRIIFGASEQQQLQPQLQQADFRVPPRSRVDSEEIPLLLPVFLDTFGDSPTVSALGGTTAAAADSAGIDGPTTATAAGTGAAGGAFNGSAPREVDYISKSDFLDFCQAVEDVKLYSIRASG